MIEVIDRGVFFANFAERALARLFGHVNPARSHFLEFVDLDECYILRCVLSRGSALMNDKVLGLVVYAAEVSSQVVAMVAFIGLGFMYVGHHMIPAIHEWKSDNPQAAKQVMITYYMMLLISAGINDVAEFWVRFTEKRFASYSGRDTIDG